MKTSDRLLAVDASVPGWKSGIPDLPSQDVMLMRLIRVASLGITACVDPLLRPSGLTESSFHTLIIVLGGGAEGTTPSALCEQVGQNRANMTRILSLLGDEKLVTVNVDRRDSRRKRIVATPAGRRLIQKYASKVAPVVGAAMDGLTDKDKREFERLLRAVVVSMDRTERTISRSV